MRYLFVEISPEAKRLCGNKETFRIQKPEPCEVRLLVNTSLIFDKAKDGPLGLYLLICTHEKYIKVLENFLEAKPEMPSFHRVQYEERLRSAKSSLSSFIKARDFAALSYKLSMN